MIKMNKYYYSCPAIEFSVDVDMIMSDARLNITFILPEGLETSL